MSPARGVRLGGEQRPVVKPPDLLGTCGFTYFGSFFKKNRASRQLIGWPLDDCLKRRALSQFRSALVCFVLSHRDVRIRFLELIAKKKIRTKRDSVSFSKMSLCFHVGQGRAGQDWGNKMPIYSLPCARERGKEMEVPIKIRSNTHSGCPPSNVTQQIGGVNFDASPCFPGRGSANCFLGIPHFPNGLWATTTRSKEHMSRGREKWASQIVVFRDPGMTSQLSLSSFPPLLFYFFCCCHKST